jgi:hypothetical protein
VIHHLGWPQEQMYLNPERLFIEQHTWNAEVAELGVLLSVLPRFPVFRVVEPLLRCSALPYHDRDARLRRFTGSSCRSRGKVFSAASLNCLLRNWLEFFAVRLKRHFPLQNRRAA